MSPAPAAKGPTPPPPPAATPGDGHEKRRWAIPPRLHVGVTFMVQFILVLALLGGFAPTRHTRGVSWWVLGPAALVLLVLAHAGLRWFGRLIPVRCRQCRAPSRYQGFGWWPFIYRYVCPRCGCTMRYEVTGGGVDRPGCPRDADVGHGAQPKAGTIPVPGTNSRRSGLRQPGPRVALHHDGIRSARRLETPPTPAVRGSDGIHSTPALRLLKLSAAGLSGSSLFRVLIVEQSVARISRRGFACAWGARWNGP